VSTVPDLRIGQAIYTWSKTSPSGNIGFGFQSVSPILAQRVQWLDNLAGPVKRFPGLDEVGNAARGTDGWILPTRYLIDGFAFAAFKTYQGVDGNNRPGSYCCQILVADPVHLTVSAVAGLDHRNLVQPLSSALRQNGAPRLADLDLRGAVRVAPAGNGAQVGPLLERFDRSGWSSIELSAEQLSVIPALMGALGTGWDSAATLDAVKVPEGLAWRLSLPTRADERATDGPTFVSTEGDGTWIEMRSKLDGCRTRDELRAAWHEVEADAPSTPIEVPAITAVDDRELSDFDRSVKEYAEGNGTRLYLLMSEFPPESLNRGLELVLDTLSTHDWTFAARGANVDDVNRRLLLAATGTWASLHPVEPLFPYDRSRLADLAVIRLIPELLSEIVARNTTASPGDVIALRFPEVSAELWRTIGFLWQRSEEDLKGLVTTFRASGPGENGLLRSLVASGPTRIPAELLFGEIVPKSFSHKDALTLVLALEPEFKHWSGLSDYYWETLRADSRAAKIWRRIREINWRPGA
jgi:hypothetical protein